MPANNRIACAFLAASVALPLREVKLQQGWQRGRLDVIAFVQSQHGRVLQAVSAQQCARP
jgi:hypothetical protein